MTVIFARVWANTPKSGRERVHVGNKPPRASECLFTGNAGLVALCNRTNPTPYVTAIGATDLAWRGFLYLPGSE